MLLQRTHFGAVPGTSPTLACSYKLANQPIILDTTAQKGPVRLERGAWACFHWFAKRFRSWCQVGLFLFVLFFLFDLFLQFSFSTFFILHIQTWERFHGEFDSILARYCSSVFLHMHKLTHVNILAHTYALHWDILSRTYFYTHYRFCTCMYTHCRCFCTQLHMHSMQAIKPLTVSRKQEGKGSINNKAGCWCWLARYRLTTIWGIWERGSAWVSKEPSLPCSPPTRLCAVALRLRIREEEGGPAYPLVHTTCIRRRLWQKLRRRGRDAPSVKREAGGGGGPRLT